MFSLPQKLSRGENTVATCQTDGKILNIGNKVINTLLLLLFSYLFLNRESMKETKASFMQQRPGQDLGLGHGKAAHCPNGPVQWTYKHCFKVQNFQERQPASLYIQPRSKTQHHRRYVLQRENHWCCSCLITSEQLLMNYKTIFKEKFPDHLQTKEKVLVLYYISLPLYVALPI